jgi:hypothetical protein
MQNFPPHHKNVSEKKFINSGFLVCDTNSMMVVAIFTPSLLYFLGKKLHYPLVRRMGGSHSVG